MSQWNESSNHLKPNQRDHFSEGVRFDRWLEAVRQQQQQRERKEQDEKHRDITRDNEADR